MAKIQCKMCGGLNDLPDGVTSGECQYCGSLTTFPKITDTQTEQLYVRAEHFRRSGSFDKAVATYESILARNNEDPEAYWGLLISRYGIEYVEDPATHERIPTCHRVQFDSILADSDYQNVLKFASPAEREIYEREANRIAEIQKGILRISAQEKPYDVFICYKEATDGGTRTKDSTLAQDIYYQLTKQGMKVFFARITLEDKLGRQYEPYIFAALNSAKVMLVIGTKKEYFEAVWVKNEWSRFLALMKKDSSKLLIPCFKDMDVYDIPEELSMFQCEDMSKIGFMQDILYGVAKVVNAGKNKAQPAANAANAPASGAAEHDKLMRRISILMEQQDWDKANSYCDKLLESDPENPELYLMMCMITRRIPEEKALRDCGQNLAADKNFRMALKFASPELKQKLEEIGRDASFGFHIGKCLDANHVPDISQLPRIYVPLDSDSDFQEAMKLASPERRQQLQQLMYAQAEFFLESLKNKYRITDFDDTAVPLDKEPLFQLALRLASPERRRQLEEIRQNAMSSFYLKKCMEAYHVSEPSLLSFCNVPLNNDPDFQEAMKLASPERRQQMEAIGRDSAFNYLMRKYADEALVSPALLSGDYPEVRELLGNASPEQREHFERNRRDALVNYYLRQCANGVSDIAQLHRSNTPLNTEPEFHMALENASPERRQELERLPRMQFEFFLKECLHRHNVSRVEDLVQSNTPLDQDPVFSILKRCAGSINAEISEQQLSEIAKMQNARLGTKGSRNGIVVIAFFILMMLALILALYSLTKN